LNNCSFGAPPGFDSTNDAPDPVVYTACAFEDTVARRRQSLLRLPMLLKVLLVGHVAVVE
jgi:hypothetical protein